MTAYETKHFVFLDGMRGIAAVAVGWLHASMFFGLTSTPHHSALAVDFFFVLSGFVIAYAYDGKLTSDMTFAGFAAKRLIRLYPLIFIGALLGSLVSIAVTPSDDVSIHKIVALGLSALLLFPLGTFLGMQPYPVNNPIWSLFFEVVANAVYGLHRGGHKTGSSGPIILLIISGVALAAVIHHYHTIELVGFSGKRSFSLGLVRVCYPFLAGVLIYRYRLFLPRFAHFDVLLALALVVIFTLPGYSASWIYDTLCIIVLFPLLISLGANDSSSSLANSLWAVLGNLSYPFYLIHQPILRASSALYRKIAVDVVRPELAAIFSVVIGVGLSYLIFFFYDRPMRRWLTQRLAGIQRVKR